MTDDDTGGANTRLHAIQETLSAFCDAYEVRGVSASRLAEMLGCRVADLHGYGLQAVANAIYDAANVEEYEMQRDAARAELSRRLGEMEERLYTLRKQRDDALANGAEAANAIRAWGHARRLYAHDDSLEAAGVVDAAIAKCEVLADRLAAGDVEAAHG